MSKVDEYTGNGMIVVSDGEVWAVDDSGLPDVIGEIGRVELIHRNARKLNWHISS